MGLDFEKQNEAILERLYKNPHLRKYIDPYRKTPRAYRGYGKIQLVVLGQDPTTDNPNSDKSMEYALDLDRNCSMRRYLAKICNELEIDLDKNVYATYCLKNFFMKRPAELGKIGLALIDEAFEYWLPLLTDELEDYRGVSTIIFDEAAMKHLIHHGLDFNVRDYWNYALDWRENQKRHFRFISAGDNRLGRRLFPFPGEANHRAEFYQSTISSYIKFMIDSSGY